MAQARTGDHHTLRESEERFRLLVDSVKDYAIFMLDPDGRVSSWNSGAQLIKGYEANEIIGRHFSVFYPQAAIERGFPDYELRVAAREGRFEDEGWRIRKDGSRFWANVVITALYDGKGALRGFGKVTRDLTQRRDNEEALRRSEERFRLLVDGVTDYAIFMLDANGYVVTWNTGAERISGFSSAEIIGHHLRTLYPQDAVESKWPEHELQVAIEQGRFVDEGWRVRKDGSRFWASVVITPLRDDEQRLRGFAKLTRDLTERRRTEAFHGDQRERDDVLEAERNARITAQRAARLKDEFLATLSHELRTPLHAILGWVQIFKLKRTPKPEDLQRGIEVIERNARVQVQLIDDLLDLSRITSGRVRLDLQEIPVGDVIRAAIDSTEPTAFTKNVRIEAVLDPQSATVSGDPHRLQQVFWNLLSNAIKFTPAGGKIQVVQQRINSQIEVRVSDTGIGIPKDYLPHVFERFSQADSSASRKHGGLGLGLAISKQLVELHGGSLKVDSPGEGLGATFTVALPLIIGQFGSDSLDRTHPTRGETVDVSDFPLLNDVHVLVVDDEADALELIRRVLEERGARVTVASSGEEALVTLTTSQPDLLVSDIGTPNMDGFQLMRHIRQMEVKNQRIPALALTAFARPEDRKNAALAGYQTHLAKPFDIAELVILVASLAGRT